MYNRCFRTESNQVNVDNSALTILDATIERIFTNENIRYVLISYVTTYTNFNVRNNFIVLIAGHDTLMLNHLIP